MAFADVQKTYTGRACDMTRELVFREMKEGGLSKNAALRAVAVKTGLSWRMLWALTYRPPKDVLAFVYAGVAAAYAREVSRQEARLATELLNAEKRGLGRDAIDQIMAGAGLSARARRFPET